MVLSVYFYGCIEADRQPPLGISSGSEEIARELVYSSLRDQGGVRQGQCSQ